VKIGKDFEVEEEEVSNSLTREEGEKT